MYIIQVYFQEDINKKNANIFMNEYSIVFLKEISLRKIHHFKLKILYQFQ